MMRRRCKRYPDICYKMRAWFILLFRWKRKTALTHARVNPDYPLRRVDGPFAFPLELAEEAVLSFFTAAVPLSFAFLDGAFQ